MRIHHLNCGTDCPLGGAMFDGRSKGPLGTLVCHCLLIETDAHGLVLVDTGYGLHDVAHPHRHPEPRITLPWRMMLNIRLHERDTAIRQIEALGFRASDVRHVVATHLDFDHAGGLDDFPDAAVHVMKREYDDATGAHVGIVARNRWRSRQLAQVGAWRTYGARGEAWFGFDAVRDLDGLPPEILLVPLPGHTWGHAGVAVRRDDGRWLLHAGDAYFYRGEMREAKRRCTPGLRAYQRLMEVDATSRMTNQARLRALSIERRGEIDVTCTHDPVELERCQAGTPALIALEGFRIALVLGGGNALGAYQAGVYAALREHGVEPHWIVGTSAGAINGAVIAGNRAEDRVARLEALWRPGNDADWPMWWDMVPDTWRRTREALGTLIAGRPGLFAPVGSGVGATPALYDTQPMLATLVRLVDFARLNDGSIRYAAAAVDLERGEDRVFDTGAMRIGPDHVRASAAMPPNFPAVAIDGRLYVDGGLSANLPLDPILSPGEAPPTLCIAVDLLPLEAPVPTTLGEVIGRTQDLIFAAQSRRSIARWRDVYATSAAHRRRSVTLIRLAYAGQHREVAGKAMDFSPESVRLRWEAGRSDAAAMLAGLARGGVMTREPGLHVRAPLAA